MEQREKSIFNFSFDDTSREHFAGISKWAAINAILAFVALGLNILQFVMATGSYRRSSSPLFNMGFRASDSSSLFFQVIISILVNVFLYMASTQIRKGIDAMDKASLTKGLASLRTYYRIYGIILIIVLVIGTLALIFISSYRRY